MEIKIWHWKSYEGPRWVLSVNGFIVKIHAEEGVVREAAAPYLRRASEIRAGA